MSHVILRGSSDEEQTPNMETTIETIKFKLDDDQFAGEALKEIPSRSELRKKGLRAAMPFWLAAIPCIFIPLLHYLLVPVLLAIGFLQGRSFWKGKALYKSGKVTCPRCKKGLEFNDLPLESPLKVLCSSCGYQLRLYELTP